MNTKNYTVRIFGQEYSIVSDEAEADIVKAAELVHGMMETVAAQGSSLSSQKVSVLAALQLANELLRAQHALEQRKQKESALASLIDQNIASL